jgi:putative peptide zinc metalloprotease protein
VGFTDTSEMWTAGKWRRAAVDIAGPWVNFLLSAVATLCIPLTSDPTVQNALFHFAVGGFLIGALNLNPLIEYDGYYVLMDLLELPNLRTKALAFLGAFLWRQPLPSATPGVRRLYYGYGALALAYVGVLAVLVLRVWETHVQEWTGAFLPPAVGMGLGIAVAGLMVWLILYRTWRDLRAGVEAAQQARAWARGG